MNIVEVLRMSSLVPCGFNFLGADAISLGFLHISQLFELH